MCLAFRDVKRYAAMKVVFQGVQEQMSYASMHYCIGTFLTSSAVTSIIKGYSAELTSSEADLPSLG